MGTLAVYTSDRAVRSFLAGSGDVSSCAFNTLIIFVTVCRGVDMGFASETLDVGPGFVILFPVHSCTD